MRSEPSAKLYELIGVLKADQGDYEGAIATFSEGLTRFPQDARLYRHRGHRYLNVSRLEDAYSDFEKASEFLPLFADAYEGTRANSVAQLEAILLNGADPDAQPVPSLLRASGKYYASLAFKIHYHFGLAQHFLGKNEEAAASFEAAWLHAETVDLQVATLNWLVVLHGVLGNQARIDELLKDVEFDKAAGVNAPYQSLLKVYKGVSSADALIEESLADSRVLATSGYGLASLLLTRGETDQARTLLERAVAEGDPYAFGSVGARARLAGLG